ncbi:uncharacterized protein LOC113136471 isoform X2 [Mastacembelus armatus]|uniref:uncharacterized protein LOC113136471 isoform X2 n=1 Tax=Mastacembelus armatus TaxID=205130 RepID=UPI000E454802|nr:uncharacterized protein LOC113136471 isoform X2 [Mastacembelus armatus]
MSASSVVPKVFIFLVINWNSSFFASGQSIHHLQISLGCQAVIPCQHKRGDSNSFKWFYKKDELSDKIQLFIEDKSGIQRHQTVGPKRTVTHNRSLVINYFAEEDEGQYWCENCYDDKCSRQQATVITKEILNEHYETIYVTAGNSFLQVCPGAFTNFKWTFEAKNSTALRNSAVKPETHSESHFVTSNKSIHIVNVQRAHAGRYSCSTSRCRGQTQKLLTVNLCVIMVHQTVDSPTSCVVICDGEYINIKPNNILNQETDTSSTSTHMAPYRSLNCSAKHIFDASNTVNSNLVPSNASNKTTGHEYLRPLIYGTSVAIVCVMLMALLIFYLRTKLWKDSSDRPSVVGRVDEDTSVIYSTIDIRGPAKTTNDYMNSNSCVYSEIKLK